MEGYVDDESRDSPLCHDVNGSKLLMNPTPSTVDEVRCPNARKPSIVPEDNGPTEYHVFKQTTSPTSLQTRQPQNLQSASTLESNQVGLLTRTIQGSDFDENGVIKELMPARVEYRSCQEELGQLSRVDADLEKRHKESKPVIMPIEVKVLSDCPLTGEFVELPEDLSIDRETQVKNHTDETTETQPLVANIDEAATLSAFMVAVRSGNREAVRAYLRLGFDVNTRDKYGRTALWYSVQRTSIDMVRLLISCGAVVELGDGAGVTPLHEAAYRRNVGAVELLLEHVKDVNAPTKEGHTPLAFACQFGCILDEGRVVKPPYSGTMEAKRQYVTLVELLLSKGAHVYKVRLGTTMTILHLVRRCRSKAEYDKLWADMLHNVVQSGIKTPSSVETLDVLIMHGLRDGLSCRSDTWESTECIPQDSLESWNKLRPRQDLSTRKPSKWSIFSRSR